MSIARENDKLQVCCDTCPASYPNTYAAEDFAVMVADAKTGGWIIQKAGPASASASASADASPQDLFASTPRIAGKPAAERFTHTCPSCANPIETGGLF